MSKIEGVPEGWELVAFRRGKRGEWTLDSQGLPLQIESYETIGCTLIIRRIEPVCTWPHGVFADGWIAEDADGAITWLAEKPAYVDAFSVWQRQRDSESNCESNWFDVCSAGLSCLCNPPKFRSDLPWTQRIQQVGPTIEATLKGET